MRTSFSKVLILSFLLIVSQFLFSCHHDDNDMRFPDDIVGIWTPDNSQYLEFTDNYTIHHLLIEEEDDEIIGIWTEDAYLYEPGYNLVIYLSSDQTAIVYEVTQLTSTKLTWCWVKEINLGSVDNAESVGNILGDIIKEAQEGFKLDPQNFQTFQKISQSQFDSLLESLDIENPWAPY